MPDGKHMVDPAGARIEASRMIGRELEIAHRHRPFRQAVGDLVDHPAELDASGVVALPCPQIITPMRLMGCWLRS